MHRCISRLKKKLWNANEGSSQIEKIFQASKSEGKRSSVVEDPFILKVPESSHEDTKKNSQKSKNDMKIVKFNVKDGKFSKLQERLKKVEEEATGVTTR